MLPAFLLLVFCSFYQESVQAEPVSWPLFEFYNPLTWLNPKFSSEAMFHILRSGRGSSRGLYQQLKKALLPADLFLGNIRTQYAAWDSGKEKKAQSSKGSSGRPNKKFSKSSPGKPE